MFYLRSYDRYLDVAEFNDVKCLYRIFHKNKATYWLIFLFDKLLKFKKISIFFKSYYINKQFIDLSNKSLDGIYSFMHDKFIALYVYEKKLFLCIDKKNYLVDKEYSASILNDTNKKVFILKQGREVIERIYYSTEEIFDKDNITPFVDEEDYDYGQFISNLINDESKKNRFISNRL